MEKIIVIGCPGAGKSTFARGLRDATGLPLYYLDQLWHKKDKTNVSRAEFDDRLSEILHKDRWIVDGNYLRTLETRIRRCDTVFFMDIAQADCLAGAQARVGRAREDMPWVETAFDPEFRQWILDFETAQLPEITRLLEKYRQGRQMIRFKSRAESDAFLSQLQTGKTGR